MDKIQIIEELFTYILVYSYLLIPLGFLLSRSKKYSLFIILASYGLVFFFYLNFYYDIPKNYRKIQQTVYTLLEYSVFAAIIWYNLKNVILRKTIFSFSILFLIFQVTYFFVSKLQKIDSVPIGVETILIFLFSFFYFQQFLKYNISKNIYEYPSFWLIVGILIYLGSAFFFNILANDVTDQQFDNYWHLTYIPEILKNLLFAMVLLGYPSYINEQPNSKLKKSDIPNLDII